MASSEHIQKGFTKLVLNWAVVISYNRTEAVTHYGMTRIVFQSSEKSKIEPINEKKAGLYKSLICL